MNYPRGHRIPDLYGGSPSADYEVQTRLAARVKGPRSPWYVQQQDMYSVRTVHLWRRVPPHQVHVRDSAPGLPHGWVSVHGPAFDKPHQLHPDSRRPFPFPPALLLSSSTLRHTRSCLPFRKERQHFSFANFFHHLSNSLFRWHFVTTHFLYLLVIPLTPTLPAEPNDSFIYSNNYRPRST